MRRSCDSVTTLVLNSSLCGNSVVKQIAEGYRKVLMSTEGYQQVLMSTEGYQQVLMSTDEY